MFNIVDTLCIKGNKALEDRIGCDSSWLFVIDGASGLTGKKVTDYDSDAAWLADNLKTGLETSLPDFDRPISEILHDIALKLREEYDSYWKKHYTSDVDYPSAGVVVMRLKENIIEYLSLGDCTLVIEDKDGELHSICEKNLHILDQKAIDKMVSIQRETGCSMSEAREAINPLLIHNRNLRNKPEGYWIFDPTGIGVDNARQGVWRANDVKGVTLMSDGFMQLLNTFEFYESFEDLQKNIRNYGLTELGKKLFEAQDDDSECMSFPRFKLRDDTSAVYATVDIL